MEVETPVEYEPAKVDHISNAGWFVEIKGGPKKIGQLARRLGLRLAAREHRSYRKLIREATARPIARGRTEAVRS